MLHYWHLIVAIILAFGTWLSFYFKKKYNYWAQFGLSGPQPLWLLGNIHQRFFTDLRQQEIQWVLKYGKLYGEYFGLQPALTIADPQLIKQVLISDFAYFTNRLDTSGSSYNELLNCNLFFSNGATWRRLRLITSPSFTSGRLKAMAPLMDRAVEKLDGYFRRITELGSAEVEVKQTMTGFTIDVVASTNFAIESTNANAAGDSNAEGNTFVSMGKALFDINPLRVISTILLPKIILRILGIDSFFPPKPFSFFVQLAKQLLAVRKSGSGGPKRNDLMQLLIDASADEKDLEQAVNWEKMTASEEEEDEKPSENTVKVNSTTPKRTLTETEVVANTIFLFVTGYDTTASTLSHCIFELAHNPKIQNHLANQLAEILAPFEDTSADGYFDSVMNHLPYLDAVIKETLRKYPPAGSLIRVCSQDGYKLGPVTLSKGQMIIISVNGVHLHPDHFPDPFTFKPERFLREYTRILVPYSYLPFSLGPRNCIAMRFAYQEIKLCLATILRRYRFELTPKTPTNLTFKSGGGLLNAEPFAIKVCRRF